MRSEDASREERRRRWAAAFLGTLFFALALGLTTSNAGVALPRAGVVLAPFDELYHAKRILYSYRNFPRVLLFDADRGVGGAFCPWPPLYDLGQAALARLLGVSGARALLVASFVPPLVTSAGIAFVAVWAFRRRGLFAAVIAAGSLAVSPFLLANARIGSIDHHFLEPWLALAVAAAVVGTVRVERAKQAVWRGLALGAALIVGLMIQTALLLSAGIAALALLATFTGRRSPPLLSGVIGFFTAASVILLYPAARAPGYPAGSWYLGLPHAACLLGASAALAVAAWGTGRSIPTPACAALALAAGAAVAAAIPGSVPAILEGSRFMGGDPWLSTIQEFAPLVIGTSRNASADLAQFGAPVLAALALVVAIASRASERRRLFVPFLLVLTLVSFGSARFTLSALPFLAIGAAIGADHLLAGGRKGWAFAIAGVALLPPLAVAVPMVAHPSSQVPASAAPVIGAARWLRHARGGGRVLSGWTWGHVFDVVGRQRVVVDNFGSAPSAMLFENALAVPLATREEHVAQACRRLGVRYVVLENPLLYLSPTAVTLSIPASTFLRPSGAPGVPDHVTRRAQASFWWRAYFDLGRARPEAGVAGRPFRLFRLVYASAERAPVPAPFGGPVVQVWELD